MPNRKPPLIHSLPAMPEKDGHLHFRSGGTFLHDEPGPRGGRLHGIQFLCGDSLTAETSPSKNAPFRRPSNVCRDCERHYLDQFGSPWDDDDA